jgi:hypothetical protein
MRQRAESTLAQQRWDFMTEELCRQILVLLIMAVEEGRLLMTVGRVVERVDVQFQPGRRYGEHGEERLDEHVPQPVERGDVDGVLEPRMCGLALQVVVGGPPSGDELEHRIGAEGVVVVLICVEPFAVSRSTYPARMP